MTQGDRRSGPDGALLSVFSIDAGRPFLQDLADGLIDRFGEELPGGEIWLPTRRAVRSAADALLDAFARRGKRAALLPRLHAIGDMDEDEMIVLAGDPADELRFAPAVSSTERLMSLARLVATANRAFSGHERWVGAISAARELAKLLDSFHMEEIDPETLHGLEIGDSAGHWENSLQFLKIVTEYWPAHLVETGRADPAGRRVKLIAAKAARILEGPPDRPLVIAGTTASAPAVRRLVAAIAQAPKGLVVLPGLDRFLDMRSVETLDDAHPQSGLATLLNALGIAASRVRAWPGSGAAAPRTRLLALSLRPAEATDDWLELTREMTARDQGLRAATEGLTLIEADNEEAEATVIAALFRETVEQPGETALLVTPDRKLARRVALKMKRWNIAVDDSAGVPFGSTPCGAFLRLVALFLEDPGDPVSLLALVRHPLCRIDPHTADQLDRALRGVRPAHGLSGVADRVSPGSPGGEPQSSRLHEAIELLQGAADLFPRDPEAPLADRLRGHLTAAERIAGAARLWSGDDGEAGATLLAELALSADAIEIAGERYSELFLALAADVTVRSRMDGRPRLAILGPLEARLQEADHVIMAGLNEGVWPSDAAHDPFLSRPMRRALGLSSPERQIGLSAHDFSMLAAHRRVTVTRAKRSGGKPANASRWLIRLRNIVTGAGAIAAVDRSPEWRRLVAEIDEPKEVKAAPRPKPRAGPGRRPERMSVTQIEKWLRDPYGVYARHLLHLRKLEEPGLSFGSREMGSLVHKTFELAALAAGAPTAESLRAIFDSEAVNAGLVPADRRFWSRAIAEALDWYLQFDAERRAAGRLGAVEGAGEWTLPGLDPPFTLTARADRIDILEDGRAAIVDYKTRSVPSERQDAVFALQLALTGAALEAGAFPMLGPLAVARYDYLRVTNRSAGDGWGREGDDARAAIREAERRLREWIGVYDDPSTPYHSQPRPEFFDSWSDYDQLARRKEWSALEEDDE